MEKRRVERDTREVYRAGGRESWRVQGGMYDRERESQRFGRSSGEAWEMYYE